jgi:hypothetical protein
VEARKKLRSSPSLIRLLGASDSSPIPKVFLFDGTRFDGWLLSRGLVLEMVFRITPTSIKLDLPSRSRFKLCTGLSAAIPAVQTLKLDRELPTLMLVAWRVKTAQEQLHHFISPLTLTKLPKWRVSPRPVRLPRLIRRKKVKNDLPSEQAQWQPATPLSTRANATMPHQELEVC